MLGVLSLIVWTLVIVTSIKYVAVAMRVDNDGEGGILALMALLGVKQQQRPAIVAVGLFGAALIYGDGAITPAISVLSALEGLDIVDARLPALRAAGRGRHPDRAVRDPAARHRRGSARRSGRSWLLWFAVIALLGVWGIVQHPAVLLALNPLYGLRYLLSETASTGFLVLGGVFLCVTGAEALYADMGHFGAGPIRLAWSVARLPEPDLQLCRPGGAGARRRADRRTTSSIGCAPPAC